MERVKDLCNSTDSKIVISSSWRLGSNSVNDLKESLTNVSLGFTKVPFIDPDLIVGMTPFRLDNGYFLHRFRGDEVNEYIECHPEIENYVILDDESNYCSSQLRFLVKTDSSVGISDKNVKDAYNILMMSLEDRLRFISYNDDSKKVVDLNSILSLIRRFKWYNPVDETYPNDEMVLCKMKSNGKIVSGYIYKENGLYKVSTDSDFHFEDYECESWTYINY